MSATKSDKDLVRAKNPNVVATPSAAVAATSAATTKPQTATTAEASTTQNPTQNPSVLGPLKERKTITVTFVPDWSQEDMRSPLRAASVCVLLGPANTFPQQALWSIEFNLFATDKLPTGLNKINEEPITKDQRALLWYEGKPFPKYKNGIVLSKCRLPHNDDLKTVSVTIRPHSDERDPNALVWVRKRSGPKRRKDLSYLKVVAGHHYYLNITFDKGSKIAELVGQGWRPIVYLYAKRQRKGVDEIQSSRLFTNFTTNWAQGVEPNVDERELKLAAEALQREAEEDAEDSVINTKPTLPSIPSKLSIPITSQVMVHGKTPANSNSAPDQNTRYGASIPLSPQQLPYSALGSVASANTLPPMTSPLVPLQPRIDIPVEWSELEQAITTKPLASIVLPSLECKPFAPEFSFEPTVKRFVTSDESVQAAAMCAIEGVARTWATDNKHPLCDAAKHMLNFFSAISQLPGWQHTQNYILDPQKYIDDTVAAGKGNETAAQTLIRGGDDPISDLQAKGKMLRRRLYQRVDWLLELQRKAAKAFDAELYMKVIATDRAWAEDANSFMKYAEKKVTEMLTKNPQKFHAFRELQRKGVQWPHSPMLRREIEQAGFVFRPMMIKRDRCICETCGVEVSGWQAYHNPWSFHNYAKHPPQFQPGVAVTLQPPTSPFVAQMVTDSNMRWQNNGNPQNARLGSSTDPMTAPMTAAGSKIAAVQSHNGAQPGSNTAQTVSTCRTANAPS